MNSGTKLKFSKMLLELTCKYSANFQSTRRMDAVRWKSKELRHDWNCFTSLIAVKLIGAARQGTRCFITVFTKVNHLARILEPDKCSSSPPIPFKTHFNSVLPSTPSSSKWFFLQVSPLKTPYVLLFSPIRAT